ncbi:TauD/TfdA dioxygenase family protein [Pelagibius marinus]|uniref:TauD/TfdA dioxygenase family protein n=1 Tax=Pelagibius marinus TaxID=2762760 RepID=UPI001872AC77|nr:TauD/TfdA family dioxygenase [Pelagibius marinus]
MPDAPGASAPIAVAPVAGAIGAEISGVDLSAELSDDTVGAIRQALLDHLVVFFRDQELTPQQFMAFAARFGRPVPYPFVKGLDEHPEITPILKREEDRINFGGLWHSDTAYLRTPPMGTILYGIEIPPYGGDTEFANQYLAYETLSAPLRRFLDGLTAVHASGKGAVQKTRSGMMEQASAGLKGDELTARHPAVRTHPETGRKALYVNVAHTTHFEGMTEEESQPILDFLFRHQVKADFTCRFRWSPGAVAFWDNRCAQHNPINDYHGFRRLMHRVTLAGKVPA